MFPGLSEADCQVAGFHYRQLVDEGQRQQGAARVLPAPLSSRAVSFSLRQQLGAFLVHAGERLQGAQTITSDRLGRTPSGEMGAIA